MSEICQDLLRAFDSLTPEQQSEVAVEILRRCTPDEPLVDDAFDEMADELFRQYDAEEKNLGSP